MATARDASASAKCEPALLLGGEAMLYRRSGINLSASSPVSLIKDRGRIVRVFLCRLRVIQPSGFWPVMASTGPSRPQRMCNHEGNAYRFICKTCDQSGVLAPFTRSHTSSEAPLHDGVSVINLPPDHLSLSAIALSVEGSNTNIQNSIIACTLHFLSPFSTPSTHVGLITSFHERMQR